MKKYYRLKSGSNITVVTPKGVRITSHFISALGDDWNIAVAAAEMRFLIGLENVDLTFIVDDEVCDASAELVGVDAVSGRAILTSIRKVQNRPLRNQTRIDVNLPCGLILYNQELNGSSYINSRQNYLSNISHTGALLNTQRKLAVDKKILLLLSLKSSAQTQQQRLLVPGFIARQVNNDRRALRYQYGVLFTSIAPHFAAQLAAYINGAIESSH